MNIQTQSLLIEIITSISDDSLIDWQSQNLIKLLVFIFIAFVVLAIKVISNKNEYAVLFGFLLTVMYIIFLIME
jgi:uncharacterized membrane protein SirB2